MTEYVFKTVWTLEAPVEVVWDAIMASGQWPEWWPYLASVVEVAPGDSSGIGTINRYTWRAPLPYTIIFETMLSRAERPVLLEGRASGDLEGSGRCTLMALGSTVTQVRYEWNVRPTKRWMIFLDPLVHRLLVWNHDQVMRAGGAGLAAYLAPRRAAS